MCNLWFILHRRAETLRRADANNICHPGDCQMTRCTSIHRQALLCLAGFISAGGAMAGIAPSSMRMDAESSACITGCIPLASHTIDTDTATGPFGSFVDLAVDTAVGSGANAFPVSAAGTTTIDSDTQFTVRLQTWRPALSLITGAYEASVKTRFSFLTDDSGGEMNIGYTVNYQRPVTGTTLDTGINFGQPSVLFYSGGKSVAATTSTSGAGVSAGSWTYTLAANTFYSVTLAAANIRAYSSPNGFSTDALDAVYVVNLPSFATAVPEPAAAMLMLGGLAALALRRRPGSSDRLH